MTGGSRARQPALTIGPARALLIASRMRHRVLVVLALAAAAAPAAADHGPITVGARVGGYGFRNPDSVDATGHVAWDACRMNGLGVFARRPLGRFFAEGGADVYFTEGFPTGTADVPAGESRSRLSGLMTVAAGANIVETRRFIGYAQLGAGLEMTSFRFTSGMDTMEDSRALPLGFVGVGGELRLGQTSFGASLRAHVMGNYSAVYQANRDTWDPTTNHLEVSPEAAAQGQFYVSYAM